jgi:hypothetical protein
MVISCSLLVVSSSLIYQLLGSAILVIFLKEKIEPHICMDLFSSILSFFARQFVLPIDRGREKVENHSNSKFRAK